MTDAELIALMRKHDKLPRIVELLGHLMAGGKLKWKDQLWSYGDFNFSSLQSRNLIHDPQDFTIHREPRVIYVNEYKNGICTTSTNEADAIHTQKHDSHYGCKPTARFIEDLTYKPEDSK